MDEKEVRMLVSPGAKKDGVKQIYVMFTRGTQTAEIVLPEYRLLSNNGFTQEETEQLIRYAKDSKDRILGLAKEVNPIKAMMKP
jgi:hypothetical protein